jgi:predicted metal-dependent HD superfamily phosphohydrolase
MEPDEDLDVLRGVWSAVCAATGVLRHDLAFQLLAAAYGEPRRHYHNARHIAQCLAELGPVRGMMNQPLAAEAAVLFHDFVYDPTRHDNEQRSADEAATALRAVGWTDPLVTSVRGMILATDHARPPADADAAAVVDVDLAIFGKGAEEFDSYERAVRREYAHVPEDAYRAGRAAVLRGFLSRPRIYSTDYFADRYEMAARRNLGQALGAL